MYFTRFLLVLLLGALPPSIFANEVPYAIRTSSGLDQARLTRYLEQHIDSLSIRGDTVTIKSDGEVFQPIVAGRNITGFRARFPLHKWGDSFDASFGMQTRKKRTLTTLSLTRISPDHIEIHYRVFHMEDGQSREDIGDIILPGKVPAKAP